VSARGRKRKYDPQPGELFFGQRVVGPSAREDDTQDGDRWLVVECPRCGRPRDVRIYRIVIGQASQCMDCSRQHRYRKAARARWPGRRRAA
jgi:hypothetical protein